MGSAASAAFLAAGVVAGVSATTAALLLGWAGVVTIPSSVAIRPAFTVVNYP